MNDLVYALGLESLKQWANVLLLPPLPMLVMILAGARLMFRRRLLAWALVLLGCIGIWLSCTTGVASLLVNGVLRPPRALAPSEIADLRKAPKTAIVVLTGGRKLLAPEYGVSSPQARTLERLRFGVWLAKETGLPLGISGGVGHGSRPGPSESEIAARVAEREFGRPARWVESASRDTNENALRTLELLRPEGIERIVLVTEAYHMRRALGAFERAGQRTGKPMEVLAAPMNVNYAPPTAVMDWMPTVDGFADVRAALHEILGRLAGA